jgi:hypothetical protein
MSFLMGRGGAGDYKTRQKSFWRDPHRRFSGDPHEDPEGSAEPEMNLRQPEVTRILKSRKITGDPIIMELSALEVGMSNDKGAMSKKPVSLSH